MTTLHLSEAEVARDLHAVLEKVRQGVEVIIEENESGHHRAVAVLRATPSPGRPISEVIASLEAAGASAILDADFARDVEEGVRPLRQPWPANLASE